MEEAVENGVERNVGLELPQNGFGRFERQVWCEDFADLQERPTGSP